MNEDLQSFLSHYLTKPCFDNFLEGIVLLDADMVVQYVNDAYLDYAKIERNQMVGHRMDVVRQGAITQTEFDLIQPQYNIYRKVGKNESYIDMIPLYKENKKIGAVIVVRDINVLSSLFHRIKERETYISQLNAKIREDYAAKHTFEDVIGNDQPCWEMAKRIALTDSSVFIVGESGTGKELMAQSIHNLSARRNRPFMDINCAALPENLLESELFGYAPGAFTGANKDGKIGLFELANGGTLFLDEITEMPYSLQSKLLRAIQERKIRRLGDSTVVNLNVRIIAATNQNILHAVESGHFRSDLYYRLAVFVIHIPPLREHRADIKSYTIKLLDSYSRKKTHVKYKVSNDVWEVMQKYPWPGNMRQLSNALEYITQVAPNGLITAATLPFFLTDKNDKAYVCTHGSGETLRDTLEKVEKDVLEQGIKTHGSNLSGRKRLAKQLGVSLSTLYTKLAKYRLE